MWQMWDVGVVWDVGDDGVPLFKQKVFAWPAFGKNLDDRNIFFPKWGQGELAI
jgi:hypothetical protein